ncbi:MAG: bifunctional 5,10-methylenetetrahydrofolate dehydrogenase/5,10-methenyltetrahydrofolate cyclohydrolase [Spirochaetaceae bacterium]|nr:bifunctional 5,10-methylenetetrahydrofolate dehydrogenase/5,10-methenyltetrahydrofolate cyclohydrolase [Spirochaetaceae bacterium]
MSARVIKGGPVAARIRDEVKAAVGDVPPVLQVLLAGDDPGSRWYAQAKAKLGARLGITVQLERFPASCTTSALLASIADWNQDPAIHGILVELPLPSGVDKAQVLAAIDPRKDVDGVTPANRGLLFGAAEQYALLPATPLACLELLAEVPVRPEGKRAAVVGRGDTVGRPLAALLVTRHATVTVCHTRTPDLAAVVREADLVFAAAGRPGVVTGAMIRPGATVVDAGITEVDGGLAGDVEWETVTAVAGAVTPVPGGVGSVTTSIIMRNVLRARALQREHHPAGATRDG